MAMETRGLIFFLTLIDAGLNRQVGLVVVILDNSGPGRNINRKAVLVENRET